MSKQDIQHPTFVHQLVWLVIMMSLIYTFLDIKRTAPINIPYSVFKKELQQMNIAEVVVKGELLIGRFQKAISLMPGAHQSVEEFKSYIPAFGDPLLMSQLENSKTIVRVQSTNSPFWLSVVMNLLPWLLIIGFFMYSGKVMQRSIGGKGGMLSFSKSRAKRFGADKIQISYSEVAGLENAKKDLQEIIEYLKNPEKYREIGAKMPKGILMMGPPGCGKTLLAKATAGEADVPFFSVSGSEFIEMFVGVGASRVRDMFEEARRISPALIFIDEIDSVGRVRGTGLGGGNDEREQTLNQILSEMDGFSSDDPIVVLAATNRPDVLDPALLRPGRFDRKLVLELPHCHARQQILQVHTRKIPLAANVDLELIAQSTVGFSGADLQNLANEAALHAARFNKHLVDKTDFDSARDKIILGDISGAVLSDEEKTRVAYHEAGHGLLAYLLPGTDPLKKITIIPRGRALGLTEQLPSEERKNYTQSYIENRLKIMLGGHCAEKLVFNEVSTGAANDLKKATKLTRQMITQWGMSKTIGPVNYQQSEEHPFLGREIAQSQSFSENAAKIIDQEVNHFLKGFEKEVFNLLETHECQLHLLAKALLENETIVDMEIEQLLNEKLVTEGGFASQ